MTNNRVYRLSDGRLWDIAAGAYVEEVPAGFEVIDLVRAGGEADEAYLIRTLEFYGYPLGELAMKSLKGIKENLANLDAQYLTPRVLAAMTTGDEYALEQWRIHEEKAVPLRTRLAELEGTAWAASESAASQISYAPKQS